VALAACDGGVRAPTVHAKTLADLPRPLPKPYDESATDDQVKARIDAAFVDAGAGGKRLIIDLGGNWCGWCRALDAVMDEPEVKPFMDANFVVVPVDVASADFKIDRNLAVLQRFGVSKVEGVPWLIVADADRKVLASTDAVTDDAHQTPQQMVDWLALYATKSAGG